MRLEQVLPHPYRDDIYINEIVTPHNEVSLKDKKMVKLLLLKEIASGEVEIPA